VVAVIVVVVLCYIVTNSIFFSLHQIPILKKSAMDSYSNQL